MKYAIIQLNGSQIRVEEGKTVTVNKIDGKEGDIFKTDQVLLITQDDKVTIGTPLVDKANIEYKITKNYQDKKIKVFKYKAKSRYRKTQGFRAQLTDIEIVKINY